MEWAQSFLWLKKTHKKTLAEEITERNKETLRKIKKRLWKKDTLQPGERKTKYINLFDGEINGNDEFLLNERIRWLSPNQDEKCNEISTVYRRRGNEIVCAHTAMLDYNSSLRYAIPGSVHAALAYANRSVCFFEMKAFKQALADIRMAKLNQNFPQHLMPKLELIRAFSELLPMVDVSQNVKQNSVYPVLANAVKLENSKNYKKYGRHLTTRYSLPTKHTVLTEEDYVKTVNNIGIRSCATCFAENRNFISCQNCTSSLFCNKNCEKRNKIHRWECNTFITRIDYQLRFIIHSILLALQAFTNDGKTDVRTTDKLMKCVKKMLKNLKKLPKINDSKSMYQFYFKLSTSIPELSPSGHLRDMKLVYVIYNLLLKIPRISEHFQSELKQRFLMHLITHHCIVNDTNTFDGMDTLSLGLIGSIFNHSCDPNIISVIDENKNLFITCRRVQRDAQLFISYIDSKQYTSERQAQLWKSFGFVCKCERCAPKKLSLLNRVRIAMHSLANRFDID